MSSADWVLFGTLCLLAVGAAGLGAFMTWLWFEPVRYDVQRLQRRALAAEEALAACRALERRYVVDEEHAIR